MLLSACLLAHFRPWLPWDADRTRGGTAGEGKAKNKLRAAISQQVAAILFNMAHLTSIWS